MDASKTHQFNVLGEAVASARIGDYDEMATSLNTILSVFFPIEGDDPFWGQAQQALVKMMIYSLIDYYLEEEKRFIHLNPDLDEGAKARYLDEMWGKVTMFNVFQMLTSMSRKEVNFKLNKHSGLPGDSNMVIGNESKESDGEEGRDGKSEDAGEKITELTAFLRLLDELPENKMRIMALQQSDAMSLMADSEKTRATVYGIALVAMLFFTEGPIQTITSASPTQSLDVTSLSFPRRLRFKIDTRFLRAHRLVGQRVVFESFRDKAFTDKYEGEDFAHETKLDERGWVEYRFKGIYDNYDEIVNEDGSKTKVYQPVYVRMKIVDTLSGYAMFKYDFEFTRGYQKTPDGRRFMQNPTTGERIMKGGTLRLGVYDEKSDEFVKNSDARKSYERDISYEEYSKNTEKKAVKKKEVEKLFVNPIEQTEAVYNVRPKVIFSITPPHLTDYIKIVIVMTSVVFDRSVGESYLTKASGKPFYKTRSILDELGNMQYNGNGIPGFQTKLSIGLGQGQEYTMVLQTLQRATCCIVKSCAA